MMPANDGAADIAFMRQAIDKGRKGPKHPEALRSVALSSRTAWSAAHPSTKENCGTTRQRTQKW